MPHRAIGRTGADDANACYFDAGSPDTELTKSA